MILVADIGNTHSVWAVYSHDTGKKISVWRCNTNTGRTADEYGAWFCTLLKLGGYNKEDIKAAVASSVVPGVNDNFRRFVERYLEIKPLFVGKDTGRTGLDIRLDRPDELGADRIVNSLACINRYTVPAIVVDFGTATTFDVLDKKGRYIGGAIAPGVELSIKALGDAAAQIPVFHLRKPESPLGTSTISALQSGLYWSYVSLVEGMIDRLSQAAGMQRKPFVVATGGLASLFEEDISSIKVVDPDLTLYGVYLTYKDYYKKIESSYKKIESGPDQTSEF